jgi:methyl-accepting chemotaxis protein
VRQGEYHNRKIYLKIEPFRLIEGTVKSISEGSGLVNSTSAAFSEVIASSAKVGELVSEIAAASDDQAQGIKQVNTAVADTEITYKFIGLF